MYLFNNLSCNLMYSDAFFSPQTQGAETKLTAEVIIDCIEAGVHDITAALTNYLQTSMGLFDPNYIKLQYTCEYVTHWASLSTDVCEPRTATRKLNFSLMKSHLSPSKSFLTFVEEQNKPKQTDRQTDRQADGRTDGQAGKQTTFNFWFISVSHERLCLSFLSACLVRLYFKVFFLRCVPVKSSPLKLVLFIML